MKTRLTSIALAFVFTAGAQTTFKVTYYEEAAPVSANSSIYAQTIAEEVHQANFDIENTSGSAQTYKIKRYDITLNKQGPDEAIAFFCFGGGCYTPEVTNSNDEVTLQPGEKTSSLSGDYQMLLAELQELSTPGFSHVKYTVYNTGNANDTLQFSMRYSDPSAGLNSQSSFKTSLSLAPNPASGSTQLLVNLGRSAECTVTIYNALGALVSSNRLQLNAGENTVHLKLDRFNKGLYFVSFEEGQQKTVRRLIVN